MTIFYQKRLNRNEILIGSRCVIGINAQIINPDFYKINPNERFSKKEPSSASIEIGDDVFIGNNVTILKGVKIGNGSTIASGSIVRDSIPENSIFNDRNDPSIIPLRQ